MTALAPRSIICGHDVRDRLEQLLDAVRVDPDEVVESAPAPSTNGLPDRIEEDIRVATVAGG